MHKGKPGEEFRKGRVSAVAERSQGLKSEQSVLELLPECRFRY